YPCVISGDKLLMIDPQQPADRVNAMVNLSKVGTLEKHGLNAEAFWAAFDGTFGINRENVKKGYFSGTLFWFPLRQKPSDLSETLYDEAKVMDLFDGFKLEASNILLFLKNLERIALCTRRNNKRISDIVKVEIIDTHGTVRQSRYEFKEKVKRTDSDYKGEDIHNVIQISISISTNDQRQISDWMVVNYFVGRSAGSSFRKLLQDKSLGYSPYVGVAAPLLSSKRNFEGHVFCFLPLPREGSRLTGLPVHVNGFFALSQNRHHLKWETDEQRGRRIDDKSILWNKYLIAQALPLAYYTLVNALLQRSNSLGNTTDKLDHIYSCLPFSSDTQSKWDTLETELYARLITKPFLYSSCINKWILLTDTCFATFCNLPQDHTHVQSAVKRCLTTTGQNYVEIPLELFDTLQQHYPRIEDLTPELLATYLHQNDAYRRMAYQDKLDILEYLLSDSNYMKMNGLDLLPLHSGGWTSFNKYGEPIYTCSEDILKILPGLEHILLEDAASLRSNLANHLSQLCSTEKTMTREFGYSTSRRLTESKILTTKWLHDVWHYISSKGIISSLTTLQLVPVLKDGTWKNPQIIDLAKLSNLLLVKSSNGDTLGDDVCKCFEIMGVTVLDSLPPWIQNESIMKYCFWPRSKSVVALLSKIGSSRNVNQTVAAFNKNCNWKDKVGIKTLLEKCQIEFTEDSKRLLREMEILPAVTFINGRWYATSVTEIPRFINGTENFPSSMPLPFACVTIASTVESLIVSLGGSKVHVEEIVIESMKRLDAGKFRGTDEMKHFMKYFLENFHQFTNNSVIVNCARNLRFLTTGHDSCRYKASELFDSSDTLLLDLLCEESLVPDATHAQNDAAIRVLKHLGLRGLDDIDCNILYKVARTLDKWSKERKQDSDLVRKAKAFMQLLFLKPSLLHGICQKGFTLVDSINSISCIQIQSRLPSYPACLRWFSNNGVLCKPSDAKDVS
ncbi:sacsin-like, partial [Mercenaria mercenaria]|uniref:sacsin-like n=1 Tax=Mercenaria mercenaria TaxID=6596 RepID=UPI00234EE7D5